MSRQSNIRLNSYKKTIICKCQKCSYKTIFFFNSCIFFFFFYYYFIVEIWSIINEFLFEMRSIRKENPLKRLPAHHVIGGNFQKTYIEEYQI